MRDPRLMVCRVQEWQREQEQMYRLLKEVRKVHRTSIWQHILGRLKTFFMTPAASEQKCNVSIPMEAVLSEEEKLTQSGFTAEEIVAFDRLRQWYQMDGREDIIILRHWEFLKLLVNNGALEL